jgi:hypothetical protein
MLIMDVYKVPILWMLGTVGGVLLVSIVASLLLQPADRSMGAPKQ